MSLPLSSANGNSIGVFNAFFTSTSAVCVTGFTIGDTATIFSLFGQIMIMLLMQLGGLGIMTITAFVYFIIGKRISLKERIVINQSLNEPGFEIRDVIISILKITFTCELLGAVIFATRFIPEFGFVHGLYISVFHSISSFCNAGFDVLGAGTSLKPYITDPIISITTMLLVIMGGLGFVVIMDIYKRVKKEHQKINMHTKFVLIITAGLILFGAIVFLCLEINNPKTLGNPELPVGSKIMGAFFESINLRSSGFNIFNEPDFHPVSKFVILVFMFIGASPAGAGGGIKTTTLAVILLFIYSVIRGKRDINFGKRRIETTLVTRAIAITFLSLMFVIVMAALLILFEQRGIEFTFEHALFEVVSSFGTVGITTDVTAFLTPASNFLIMLTMFSGRVGMLTLTLAIASRTSKEKNTMRYPEENVMVG